MQACQLGLPCPRQTKNLRQSKLGSYGGPQSLKLMLDSGFLYFYVMVYMLAAQPAMLCMTPHYIKLVDDNANLGIDADTDAVMLYAQYA